MTFDGGNYQDRFDVLAARGIDVHGEARFVCSLDARSVLDAGCGTGRVAIELAKCGVEVVGVDRDASMLAVARARAPGLTFLEADLVGVELGRHFDTVLMAGNIPLFVDKGTERQLVASMARHLEDGGRLVAGFQLRRGYGLDAYDADCERVGLALVERYATWDRAPFAGGDYAVSLHARRADGTEIRRTTSALDGS